MADWDNDGDLDLALVNGRVLRAASSPGKTAATLTEFWKPYAQSDQILLNDGDGKFRDISPANPDFSAVASVSRGLACGDMNNDGKLDLLVCDIDGAVRLYRNASQSSGRWLTVRAVDPTLNRDAYGAEIHVQAAGQRWMRLINPAYSYLTSNDPRAHFGLGEVDRIDSITVRWPDGSSELFSDENEVDRMVVLHRGRGKVDDQP